MTGRPDVSVIIPYYNHGDYLHAAVQSALGATRRAVEVLVVNDGSPERGATTFLEAAKALSPNVRVIAKENGGLSSARNAGLDEARGDYIQFLDSDDVLYKCKIDFQIDHLRARPDLGASVCHYALGDPWLVNLDTHYDSIGRFPLTPVSFLMKWERGFSVPIHCGLFRRHLFDGLRFDTGVHGKEDWIFWTELLDAEPSALGYLPILGAVYRMHGGAMTRSEARMGESFVTAAAKIGERWRDRHAGFEAAARRWHRQYYAPRIQRERLTAPAAVPPKPVASPDADRPWSSQTFATAGGAGVDAARLDIVTPVFNHYAHLATCINSALAQPEVGRVILVDDASSDERVQPFLENWAAREPRLTYVRNARNLGISASQNLAVSLSTAEFIGFLDCDDFLSAGAGAALVAHMAEDPADYYFTDRQDIDVDSRPIRIARYGGYAWLAPSGSIEHDLSLGMVASHWKVIRRESYQALGGSDTTATGIQDWAFALEACGRLRFSYLPKALYNHRIHAATVTSGHRLSQAWKTNVVRRRHLGRLRPASGREERISQLFDHGDLIRLAGHVMNGGSRVWFDDQGRDISTAEIDLLREFNSFFEGIRLGENAAVALSGYLWDHHLVEIGETPIETT